MKVLFATGNPAKVERYKSNLEELGIEVLTLKDLDFKINVDENGKNAIENATIKAKAYYEKLKIPTIGLDDNLYIQGIPDDKQPGTHVRRVDGKELTDDEMITHYTNLVKEYGEKLTAKWVYGMVVYKGDKQNEYTWSSQDFYFVSKPCEKRNVGYPLDSIAIIPQYDEYLANLTSKQKEERNKIQNKDEIIKFIEKSLEM